MEKYKDKKMIRVKIKTQQFYSFHITVFSLQCYFGIYIADYHYNTVTDMSPHYLHTIDLIVYYIFIQSSCLYVCLFCNISSINCHMYKIMQMVYTSVNFINRVSLFYFHTSLFVNYFRFYKIKILVLPYHYFSGTAEDR